MGFSFEGCDWSCSSRLSVCSDESVDALNVEDSSEHKTDPVVGRMTMCQSVKNFENCTKEKLCGTCVAEFVKWVFVLRLAIGSCSLRLSVCSVGSEDALILEDSSEYKTLSAVGRNNDVQCEAF